MPDWMELAELIVHVRELAAIVEIIQIAMPELSTNRSADNAMYVLWRLMNENADALDAWLNEYKEATSEKGRQKHEQLAAS